MNFRPLIEAKRKGQLPPADAVERHVRAYTAGAILKAPALGNRIDELDQGVAVR